MTWKMLEHTVRTFLDPSRHPTRTSVSAKALDASGDTEGRKDPRTAVARAAIASSRAARNSAAASAVLARLRFFHMQENDDSFTITSGSSRASSSHFTVTAVGNSGESG